MYRRRGKDGRTHIVINKKQKKNNDNLMRLGGAALGLTTLALIARADRRSADKFNAWSKSSAAAAKAEHEARAAALALERKQIDTQHAQDLAAKQVRQAVDSIDGNSIKRTVKENKIEFLRWKAAKRRNELNRG